MATSTRRRTAWVVAALLVVVAGVAAAWLGLVPSSAPERLALSDDSTAVAPAVPGAGELVGAWDLVDGTAGYRVPEPILDRVVVGRTDVVDGTVVVTDDGGDPVLTGVEVSVDLGSLTSDAAGRDRALRGRLVESDRFPDATFRLQDPVPLAGVGDAVTVRGVLTARERDVAVTWRVTVRGSRQELEVVGRAPILITDFGVDIPGDARFVDEAEVEFQAVFVPR